MGNKDSSSRAAEKDKKREKKHGHRTRSQSPSSKKRKSKKSKKELGDYPLLVRFFGFKGTMKPHWLRRRGHHSKHTHHKKGKDAGLVFHKDSNHKKRDSHRSSHKSSKGDKSTRHSRHGSSRHGHRDSSRHSPGRGPTAPEPTISEHSVFDRNGRELQLYDPDESEDEDSSGTEDLTPRPSQRLSDEPLRPDDSASCITGGMGRMHLGGDRG